MINFKITDNSYALLGNSIKHSISPMIHEFIMRKNNCCSEYEIIDAEKNNLKNVIELLKSKNINFNVTVPYKETVLEYLDEIDKTCTDIGSVNTVKNVNGKLIGYSTDNYGFAKACELQNVKLENKTVSIIGSGGTARILAYECVRQGANTFIIARNKAAADDICKNGKITAGNDKDLTSSDIIINTTPVGMWPKNENHFIDIDKMKNVQFIFDAIYNPICTKLIINAKNAGVKAVGGLDMLISQAELSQKIWNSFTLTDSQHKQLKAECKKHINKSFSKKIILTGFMGCGKSSSGKILAELLGYDFIDLDDFIVENEKMTVNDIFEKHGEQNFRQLENTYLSKALQNKNCVIALGGGCILNENNYNLLKENTTFLFYLDSAIDSIKKRLAGDSSRPMLKLNDIDDLYYERKSKYEKLCDFKINADKSPKEIADEIYNLLEK